MAAAFLSRSAPAELIVEIFASCDAPSSVIALSSTCRHLRQAWLGNASRIIWAVWPRIVPCLNEALIASRITKLVRDAQARDELPPMDIPLATLSGHVQKPTIEELQAALGLEHLARAIEIYILQSVEDRPSYLDRPRVQPPETPDRMPEWSERVRKAILRSFILGAALCGLYVEPFLEATLYDDPELEGMADWEKETYSEQELEYLKTFTVYSMKPEPESETALFGPLAQWLIDSILSDEQSSFADSREGFAKRFAEDWGRARRCNRLARESPVKCDVNLTDGGEHSDAHLVLWQVMQIFWVYGHMDQYSFLFPASLEDLVEPQKLAVTTHAIPFGWFKSLEFAMPEFIDSPAANSPRRLIIDIESEPAGDYTIENALLRIHASSPHHTELSPEFVDGVGPLKIKFFDYILKRHLGVRFHNRFFEDGSNEYGNIEEVFRLHMGILAHDDVDGRHETFYRGDLQYGDFLDGGEMVISCDPAPTPIYHSP